MSNLPLVSVVLPTYNRAYCISRAITSVLNQSYSNLELIIIDDASSDNTGDIVKAIVDPRIFYKKIEKNRGPAGARNVGLAKAKGDLIAFIDSDDIWLPGKLAFQIDILQKYSRIDILFSDFININHIYKHIDTGFNQTHKGLKALKINKILEDVFEIIGLFSKGLLIANFVPTPSVLLRSNLIKKIGCFNELLIAAEDMEFWLRADINNINFAYTTQVFIERHKDQTSLSATSFFQLQNVLKALDVFYNNCLKSNRIDLLKYIKIAKGKVYQNMIKLHALQGNKRGALQSFAHCWSYGGSWRSIYYLAGAFLGPRIIKLFKKGDLEKI